MWDPQHLTTLWASSACYRSLNHDGVAATAQLQPGETTWSVKQGRKHKDAVAGGRPPCAYKCLALPEYAQQESET
jgi:hypothetical protein